MAAVREGRTEEAEGPCAINVQKTGGRFRILFLPMIDNAAYFSKKPNSPTHVPGKAGVQLEAGMPVSRAEIRVSSSLTQFCFPCCPRCPFVGTGGLS